MTRRGWSSGSFRPAEEVAARLLLPTGVGEPVEAFSAEGEMVGSHIFGISTTQTLFLVDVLESLGVSELTGGQIRVRKLDGDGVMWGLLATLYDDGRISVSLGANP